MIAAIARDFPRIWARINGPAKLVICGDSDPEPAPTLSAEKPVTFSNKIPDEIFAKPGIEIPDDFFAGCFPECVTLGTENEMQNNENKKERYAK